MREEMHPQITVTVIQISKSDQPNELMDVYKFYKDHLDI